MRMIEELFYGNIRPCEESLCRGSEYSQLLNLAVKNEGREVNPCPRCLLFMCKKFYCLKQRIEKWSF